MHGHYTSPLDPAWSIAMSRQTRREFVKTSVAASAVFSTFTIAGTKASGKVLGANEAIRVAVAGIKGRGGSHISEFAGKGEKHGTQITYLIDPDSRLFEGRSNNVKRAGGNTPTCVQDFRRALDDKNVDVLSIAAPNHWHAPLTIFACQADKDVYVEKPASHNIHEGRIAVETARKHNRIVQHGTQGRSGSIGAYAAALAQSGKVGKLLISRGLCYKRRDSGDGLIPSVDKVPTPDGLDFNLWLGPATDRPYQKGLVHYTWHWTWDFGNGDIGNQGVHEIDKARWGIPGATLPKSVISIGGRFGPKDHGQTANTQVAIFDYGETQLIFEVRGLETEKFYDQGVGNIYHYEQGTLAGGRFYPNGSKEPTKLDFNFERARRPEGGDHFGNFIAAVRSRKVDDLNADILEGHYSAALCHLANVSYRLGQEVPYDAQKKAFGDNKAAVESIERMNDHLKDNGLPIEQLTYRVGRTLNFDPSAEKFVDDSEANSMLTRNYRAPFTVPEKVA
jgi:predicted dehydrogenase